MRTKSKVIQKMKQPTPCKPNQKNKKHHHQNEIKDETINDIQTKSHELQRITII